MAHYAIVVVDPDKHHAQQIKRTVEHNVRVHVRPGLSIARSARLHVAIDQEARKIVGAPREVGDLHTTADDACPDGLPNCRNCGDPDFAESCAASGHCQHCGTRHGIAPDAHLADGGMELKAVDPPTDEHVWSAKKRTFVKK